MGYSPEPSPTRRAKCRYQPDCPGCPHYGIDGVARSALERLSELSAQLGCPPPEVVTTPGFGSRHRVRLSVRGTAARVRIGIFRANSHDLVGIEECPLHHPSIVAVTRELRRLLEKSGIAPYREPGRQERRGSGLVRAVQLAVERPSQAVQVVLVAHARPTDQSPELTLLRALGKEIGTHPLVQGVFVNFQPLPTNTLVGEVFEQLTGRDVLEDTSGGASLYYPPGAFGQANPAAHDLAVERIGRFVGDRPVMDYFSGVGTIGLRLVGGGRPVWFNELGRGSLDGLRRGLAVLPPGDQFAVFEGPAEDHAAAFRDLGAGAVVVVDPPRKGLPPSLLEEFSRDPRPEVLYLSCGLPSFLRDAQTLVLGGYRLVHMTAFSYFPFSEHVETLGRFV